MFLLPTYDLLEGLAALPCFAFSSRPSLSVVPFLSTIPLAFIKVSILVLAVHKERIKLPIILHPSITAKNKKIQLDGI